MTEQTIPLDVPRRSWEEIARELMREVDELKAERVRLLSRLEDKRSSAHWVPDSSLGDNWPLPHWRCTGCGEIVGCHVKPVSDCKNCAE